MHEKESKNDISVAFNLAADILARRQHSTEEFKIKLYKKKFDPNIIEQIISDFTKKKYLNDLDFSVSYIKELYQKSYGLLYIKQALLYKKQIDETIIYKAIENYYTENNNGQKIDEQKIISKLILKKNYNFTEIKEKTRAINYLQRRGFILSDILSVIEYLQ